MIGKLKNKITELENKKEKLRGNFDEYDLPSHLETYIELKGIDYALKTLKEMLIEELLSGEMNIKDFFLWTIKDIISYAKYETGEEEDIEFLTTDKRALRIMKRYNINFDDLQ